MFASRFMIVFAFAAVASLVAAPAPAQNRQSFPTKPVRFVAGAFGSPSDMLARTLAPKLSDMWGKPVVVENRTGGAGTLQATTVAQATPDGHTLLLISAQFAIGAALRPASLPYNAVKDFAGVTQIGFSTSTLNVAPALGVKTLKEFVALARSKPGKLLFSSGGGGSSTHISAERFNLAAGITGTHVGFKGTPDALLEVVGGRVQYCLVGLGSAMPFIKDGRLLALAVSTPKRSPLLPDVPAIVEFYPSFGTEGAHAIFAPAKTPLALRQRISRDVHTALQSPEVHGRLDAMSYNIAPTTPTEHDRTFREQIQSFAEIGKRLGLTER
ncbi:MAG: Bug family tripartite tricarboxylate transporter substrate binding protein [Burkholderiales bacterium]